MSERCPNCGSRHKRVKGFGIYCGPSCRNSHEAKQGSNPDGSTAPSDIAGIVRAARERAKSRKPRHEIL